MSKEQVKQVENEDNCMNEAFAGALLSAQRNIRPIPWDGEDIYTRKNMELLIQTCTEALHSSCFYMRVSDFDLKEDWLHAKAILKHVPSGKSHNYEVEIPICKGEWAYAHSKAMALFLRGLLFPSYELRDCRQMHGPQTQAVNCR